MNTKGLNCYIHYSEKSRSDGLDRRITQKHRATNDQQESHVPESLLINWTEKQQINQLN